MFKLLFQFTLLSLVLGQFALVYKSGTTNLYLFDVAVVLVGLIYVTYSLSVTKKLFVPKTFLYMVGFVVVGGVSLYSSSYKYGIEELTSSAFYLVRLLAYIAFALGVFNLISSKKITGEYIKASIVYSGVLLVILGIIQLTVLPDFETLDPLLGWDPHKNRLASTFFDPNFVGAYLALCLAIVLDGLVRAKRITFWDVVKFLILFVGIILTFSRSAWLTTGVVFLIYGIFKNRILLVVALLAVVTAYYSVPRIQTRISNTTDPADSAQYRLISWGNTVEIIKDNPVLGVGYNTLRYVQKDYGFVDQDTFLKHSTAGSDSSLLFVLATTGIVGFVVFILGVVTGLIRGTFLYKVAMVAILVNSIFINSLFYPQILFLWLVLMVTESTVFDK